MREYERNFIFRSATKPDGIEAKFDLEEGRWIVTTDMTPYLQEAAEERELLDIQRRSGKLSPYRRFAVIPDICAIFIKEHYGIDIFHKDTMKDTDALAKWKKIFVKEFPSLVIST